MASITKRNDSYIIRVSLGYDGQGKQIQRFKTWSPAPNMTKKQELKELERQTVLFAEQCQNGQYMSGNIKFSEFAVYWVKEYATKQLRARTLENYKLLLKRINQAIGNIRLDKLQPRHLMEFYNNLSEDNIREDILYTSCGADNKKLLTDKKLTQIALSKLANVSIGTVKAFIQNKNIVKSSADKIANALNTPTDKLFIINTSKKRLSPNTILKYHRVISSILEKAVKWQIILYNPCQRVEPPKAERKEKTYLDEVQARTLEECLQFEPLRYRAMITTLLYTGMRRGELCGLEWKDIDFKNCLIDINKSSLYTPGKGVFDDTTKTESSKRIIKVPLTVIALLKQHQTEQAAERLKLGDMWTNTSKVFTQANGKPIHPDTVSSWFKSFLKRYNLPCISLHSLRHTNASLLIAGGTDLRTVSKRLGHANMTTTANIYPHAIQSADEKAAATIDNLLSLKKSI